MTFEYRVNWDLLKVQHETYVGWVRYTTSRKIDCHRGNSPFRSRRVITLRVRFHLRGAVTTARSRFLAYSVFMLCVSTTAGRKRDGGRCPRRVRRNGSWSHFSLGSGSGFETIGLTSLEVSKPRCWYQNTPIALKLDRRFCCCAADPPVKYQNDWRIIWISRLRHFTES